MPTPHVWGESSAADRIWAQVSGLGSRGPGRVFVALQAFIDDSMDEDGWHVLGGCIATAESWANFSREWERLLPGFGVLGDNGKYHFKMSEMALLPDRMARVPIFFKVIEEHVLGYVSARIHATEMRRALSRVWVPGVPIDWGPFRNAWFFTFRCLMDLFHNNREKKMAEYLSPDQKIDFWFDMRSERRGIRDAWDGYMKKRPEEIRKYYGADPEFKDDDEYLALQAGDFWAWWIRKWSHEGNIHEKLEAMDFGSFKHSGKKDYFVFDLFLTEDQMVSHLKSMLRDETPNNWRHPIYEWKGLTDYVFSSGKRSF